MHVSLETVMYVYIIDKLSHMSLLKRIISYHGIIFGGNQFHNKITWDRMGVPLKICI